MDGLKAPQTPALSCRKDKELPSTISDITAQREGNRKRDKDSRNSKKSSANLHHQGKVCSTKSLALGASSSRSPGRVITAGALAEEYIYQPQPERAFSAGAAHAMLKEVLESRLGNRCYDAKLAPGLAMQLADTVKQKMRELRFERYKLVCFVVLGTTQQADILCCSRSMWSPACDTFAEYCFRNSSLFALCVVYALYCE